MQRRRIGEQRPNGDPVRRPFDGASVEAMIYQHVHVEVPRLPPFLRRYQAVLDTMLAKEPADRFADSAALLAALEKL